MTRVIVPIAGESIDQIRDAMSAALEAGAELVELRLDLIEEVTDDELRALGESTAKVLPILLTCRSPREGGGREATDLERLEKLESLGPIADYVDIEFATWTTSPAMRAFGRAAARRAGMISQSEGREVIEQGARRGLILSLHDFQGRPPGLHSDLLRIMSESECDVVKLAWRARTIRDNFEAFELLRISPKPTIAICMGEEGLLSRVLAGKFGAFATFASLGSEHETAPGQLPVSDLIERYRWRSIGSATRVYGVIGDSVAQSVSPFVHNAAFHDRGLDAVYLPLKVTPGYEPFKAFLVEVLSRPWLDFAGFSVTLPHKENAYRFIIERDGILDEASRKSRAVNTIRVGAEGALEGRNTDYSAIQEWVRGGMESLPASGEARPASIRSALVLGAGGVARAAVAALGSLNIRVTIANRTHARAVELADQMGAGVVEWEQRGRHDSDMILNGTRVGMSPADEESPMSPDSLKPGRLVFDTIYNPAKTRLLRDAAERGCRCFDGVSMFALQAAAQFEAWTGERWAGEPFRRWTELGVAWMTRGPHG